MFQQDKVVLDYNYTIFCVTGLITRPHQDRSPQIADIRKEFGLISADIDKEVGDEQILEFYPLLNEEGLLPNKWRLVAAHLGLTIADIDAIEHSNRSLTPCSWPYNKEEGMVKGLYVLQKWKNNGTFNRTATYHVLLEALIRCECTSSAKQIYSKQIIAIIYVNS